MTDDVPYGEWPSPLDAATVTADRVSFGTVAVDDGTVYWIEWRPDEEGRGVVCRAGPDGGAETGVAPEAVTPADVDVRTLVHEYGGGDFTVHDGVVYYADFDDQRLYRLGPEGEPEPITPVPPVERGARYADATVSPDGERLFAVRERHYGPGTETEAVNELVSLPTDGSEEPTVVASGHDFYSFPRCSPSGDRIAWTTWDHPRMPWDGTTLHVADVNGDGQLDSERTLLGGPEESVFQPNWSPDGDLYAVSDRTGWWNVYRVDADGPVPVHEDEAEYGVPQWVFGLSTYTFLDDGRLAAVRNGGDGHHEVLLIDPATGDTEPMAIPYDVLPRTKLVTDGETMAAVVGGPTTPPRVVRWHVGETDPTVLRRSFEVPIDPEAVAIPEHVTVPTGTDGSETTHAYYYPPTNPDATGPDDERPPLLAKVHGGPTSETDPVLDLGIQYFTSRGFGVVDVNYRGSTGHGRAYRDRLQGEWGVVDTEDVVNAATWLADEGRVDGERLAVSGGSAGGFATLCALAFHDAFDAGASYYGVGDLRALAEDTHKFESRYLDGMVGPLPEAEAVYRERSPVFHATSISSPLLVLQGGEDRVVPQEQAEDVVDALVETGVPYAYLLFPEERHGFRTEQAQRRALQAELGFYAGVFGFTPDDDLPPLELAEGERVTQRVPVGGGGSEA